MNETNEQSRHRIKVYLCKSFSVFSLVRRSMLPHVVFRLCLTTELWYHVLDELWSIVPVPKMLKSKYFHCNKNMLLFIFSYRWCFITSRITARRRRNVFNRKDELSLAKNGKLIDKCCANPEWNIRMNLSVNPSNEIRWLIHHKVYPAIHISPPSVSLFSSYRFAVNNFLRASILRHQKVHHIIVKRVERV